MFPKALKGTLQKGLHVLEKKEDTLSFLYIKMGGSRTASS